MLLSSTVTKSGPFSPDTSTTGWQPPPTHPPPWQPCPHAPQFCGSEQRSTLFPPQLAGPQLGPESTLASPESLLESKPESLPESPPESTPASGGALDTTSSNTPCVAL